MGTSTCKTSTILVSTGKKKKTRVFRSMEEIPANLRDNFTRIFRVRIHARSSWLIAAGGSTSSER